MIIDTDAIKRRLFDSPAVRARLVRDYGLLGEPADPEGLASAILQKLGQTPVEDPLAKEYTNKEVFRAAVRAMASNNRAWANFLRHESRLAKLLGDYDPEHTHNATTKGALCAGDLQQCLPGRSSGADASAILKWAQLLTETDDYYAFVCDIGLAM